LFDGWSGPRDAFEEWRRVSAGRPCDYSGMTWEAIEEQRGIQWPSPDGQSTARLYTDRRFGHPDARARVFPVSPRSLQEPPSERYPFTLNTGRTVEHWHTRTKTGRVPILEGLSPEAWVDMHPADAVRLALPPGGWVKVMSRRGSIDRIRLRVTPIVRRGEVFIPFHWEGQCANHLTADEFDPISREPNYKQCAVRVQRARP
jgi:assimilatory nitrate reductase catalytic subunit